MRNSGFIRGIGIKRGIGESRFHSVKARRLVCDWCTRELGMTTVELAKKLNLSQSMVSESAMRGQKIVAEEGLGLLEKIKL